MTHSKGNDAVRHRTARACDSCIRKRARWFCAADDAFLCHACDSSVHSVNPLASRHHRVPLKTASFDSLINNNITNSESIVPPWEIGFTKKPRTPRQGKQPYNNKALTNRRLFNVVPEVGSDDINFQEESVEQLLLRVPVCTATSSSMASPEQITNGLFLSSEIGLAEVESLLGKGVENECVGMESLGHYSGKVEEEEEEEEMMMGTEEGFDCDDESQAFLTCGKVEQKENDEAKRKKKVLLLQLDYEAVITAWATQNSHWTVDDKPDLLTHHCIGTCGMEFHQPYSDELGGLFGNHPAMVEGGREARVSRYREKRQRRLFSKKIRYEVRKLNAEKRPRMKGRFVKRASLSAPTSFGKQIK